MRFSKVFYRYAGSPVGPATVQLGTDSAPITAFGAPGTAPAPPGSVPAANVDNILFCRPIALGTSAVVSQVAVVMVGPGGAANQNSTLYQWDAGTGHWYQVGGTVALVTNVVSVFPIVCPAETPQQAQQQTATGVGVNAMPTFGGTAFMLVVAASTPTAGGYLFAMTADLSSSNA